VVKAFFYTGKDLVMLGKRDIRLYQQNHEFGATWRPGSNDDEAEDSLFYFSEAAAIEEDTDTFTFVERLLKTRKIPAKANFHPRR
jgi:hypothetical protein